MTEATQFYLNPIATPLAEPKLDKKILRLTKKREIFHKFNVN